MSRSFALAFGSDNIFEHVFCIGNVNVWHHLSENVLESFCIFGLLVLLLTLFGFCAFAFKCDRLLALFISLPFCRSFWRRNLLGFSLDSWSTCYKGLYCLRVNCNRIDCHSGGSGEWVLFSNLDLCSLIKLMRSKQT